MLALRNDPGVAVRTWQCDAALRTRLVLAPSPPLLRRDRAFHINALAGAVSSRACLQLRDLVRFAARFARHIHAVGLGDHDDTRGESGATLITAAARHKLERGAVAERDRFDASAATAAAGSWQEVAILGTLDDRQDILPP